MKFRALLVVTAAFYAGREVVNFLLELDNVVPRALPESDTSSAAREGESEPGSDEAATPTIEVASDDDQEIREANRALMFTLGGFTAAGLGLLYRPLRFLSLPLLAYGMLPVAQNAWRSYTGERRLTYPIVELAQATTELLLGRLVLTAGGLLLYTGGNRMLVGMRRRARQLFVETVSSAEDGAWVLRDDAEVLVPFDAIVVGDQIVIRAGDSIPVDGCIVEGVVGVDQSALTGEAGLVELTVGDSVLAATTVLSGDAIISAERTSRETVMARVVSLLATTTSYEQSLRDRVSRVTDRSVRPTLALAGYGLLTRGPGGLIAGLWTNALDMMWVTSPLSMFNTLQAAGEAEILIKDGRSLEIVSDVDFVVFDKTGTLTVDQLELVAIYSGEADAHDDHALLRLAAALERRQSHPLARAIVRAASGDPDPLPEVEGHEITVGFGVRGRVAGRDVLVGSRRYLAEVGVVLPESFTRVFTAAEQRGHTAISIAIDGHYAGALELAPTVRGDAGAVVEYLRERGVELMVLSGDEEGPTRVLAEALGISRYRSGALPEDKVAVINALQAAGRRVCFVGDGINDALAMRRANLSVSLAGASSIAAESAQVILRADGLRRLPTMFELGDHYAADQRLILGASVAVTTLNAAGLILANFSLLPIVGLYAAGALVSFSAALMPSVRDYRRLESPAEPEVLRPRLALPRASDRASADVACD